METRYEDLNQDTVTTTAEAALVGRLNAAVLGVTSTTKEKKKVTGVMAKCANLGYLIGRLGGKTVFTFDMACLNAMLTFADLQIDVAVGETLALSHKSTSGGAPVSATLRYELETTP